MAFILTRINVGDYDRWKPMFDQDTPGARADARGHRIMRNADEPNEVFLLVEFASTERRGPALRSCSPQASSIGSPTGPIPRSWSRPSSSTTEPDLSWLNRSRSPGAAGDLAA